MNNNQNVVVEYPLVKQKKRVGLFIASIIISVLLVVGLALAFVFVKALIDIRTSDDQYSGLAYIIVAIVGIPIVLIIDIIAGGMYIGVLIPHIAYLVKKMSGKKEKIMFIILSSLVLLYIILNIFMFMSFQS